MFLVRVRKSAMNELKSLFHGSGAPKKDAVVVGFRASGLFLEQIWIPLTKRFPAKTPTQVMREAVALRAFVEFVPCVIMGEILKTEDLPGVPTVKKFFHIAKADAGVFQNLSLRVSGDFLEYVWLPLTELFPQKLPSDLLREALVLRNFVEVNRCVCVIEGRETDIRAHLWDQDLSVS